MYLCTMCQHFIGHELDDLHFFLNIKYQNKLVIFAFPLMIFHHMIATLAHFAYVT
jgi:hypothetical protein